ncbi:MAG: ATP-dependent sacrificial sulfur transferase LarE [Desulfosoma sp.]|uniref:ATP-dependent sacrificial sulfur transferase LarE n=1 Tax=Desulfosoma sp. TaxID=2603217 RepID=UPI00404A48EB
MGFDRALENKAAVDKAAGEKMARLEAVAAPWKAVAVAYSGGVDSTVLAWLLHHAFGKPVHLYLVKSPFLAVRELSSAQSVAQALNLPLQILPLDLLAVEAVRINDAHRCYYCKAAVMDAIGQKRTPGTVVVDGSHADDAIEDRPGRKALVEKGILSPLALAGWTKVDIRRIARAAGLPNWNKPSESCLATRVPYGTQVCAAMLERIEAAEELLYGMGCLQVRVRCRGERARIQVGREDARRLHDAQRWAQLLRHMARLGFFHVELDSTPLSSG